MSFKTSIARAAAGIGLAAVLMTAPVIAAPAREDAACTHGYWTCFVDARASGAPVPGAR
jgi:hypothetical protein